MCNQVSYSHGKAWKQILSWKMGKQNKVMQIENILKMSWNGVLLIANHAQEVPIIYRPAVIGLLEAINLRSRNCNVRQEPNHVFDSTFSVLKDFTFFSYM